MRSVAQIACVALVFLGLGATAFQAREPLADLQMSQVQQVAFRFWVPVAAVEDVFPGQLRPAPPRYRADEALTPEGSVDAWLLVRFSAWGVLRSEAGASGELLELVDGCLLLAAEAPDETASDGLQAALLVEFYCSDRRVVEALAGAGVPALLWQAEHESVLRADSRQLIEGALRAEGYDEWRFRALSTDIRQYEPPGEGFTAFYETGQGVSALSLRFTDDYFYFQAVAEIVFGDHSPLDRWQGWRRADGRSIMLFADSAEIQLDLR